MGVFAGCSMSQWIFTGTIIILGVFALVTGAQWSDTAVSSERDTVIFNAETAARLKAQLTPLNLGLPPVHTPMMRVYFKFYDMPTHAGPHYFGFIPSGRVFSCKKLMI